MAAGDELMYPVSRRFLDSINGTHEMVARARICTTRQTGINPVGVEVPILDGDVKITRTADVKRTCEVEVPGEFWDDLQPYGVELFLERGIDFGDGTQEWVPLGYYRVQELDQQSAPRGPVRVSGRDRNAQLLDYRRPWPVEVQDGTTHRDTFQALINATIPSVGPYRAFDANGSFVLPITWTGYNPDTTTLNGDQVWEDSCYEFLAKLAESLESVLAFRDDGTLEVAARDRALTSLPVWTVRAGEGGNLLRCGRSVSRDKVYNIVTAYGSDPEAPVAYQARVYNNAASPLDWQGRFGPVMRYYASPLIRTTAQAIAAGDAVLARYTSGLPTSTEIEVVPNPALRPNDLLRVEPREGDPLVVQVDELTIPLVNRGTSTVRMITQNAGPDDGEVSA